MDEIEPERRPRLVDEPEPRLWLVDGYNLINVGLLAGRPREAWWSGERRRELLARVAAFDADARARVEVVFDGPDRKKEDAGRVRVVYAPDADDHLLAQIPADGGAALVTADRRLAERARRRGARVVSPSAFLARCPEVG